MAAINSKFSNFADGGALAPNDIVVGLRAGVNTRFSFTDPTGVFLPLSGGTMTGNINMGVNLISNLATPVSAADATTKAYVDSAIATSVSGYLSLAGGTMTGAIAMGNFRITGLSNPLLAQDAATKAYADAAASGSFLALAGGTMTGNINMGVNLISNLATPLSAADAVTKAYADLKLALAGGTMTGAIAMNGNNVAAIGTMSFANSGFTVSFTAPTLAGNSNYVLPPTFPSINGYILGSSTLGVMTWIANTAGSMVSVVGTANQLNVDATDPQNPILSLSSTVNLPGTFNIQSTTAINAILDEDNMVSNSATAVPTQQSVKAYVDTAVGGGSLTWSEQTGTTQAIAVQNGYILNNAALVTATLPATAAIGQIFELVGKGAGLFRLAQNALQTVHISGDSTTAGVGGSLTAVDRYASLQVICITANTNFVVKASAGNFTLV